MRLMKTKKEEEMKGIIRRYSGRVSKEEAEKDFLSEVGFEPTPTDVDCDLNAAP